MIFIDILLRIQRYWIHTCLSAAIVLTGAWKRASIDMQMLSPVGYPIEELLSAVSSEMHSPISGSLGDRSAWRPADVWPYASDVRRDVSRL